MLEQKAMVDAAIAKLVQGEWTKAAVEQRNALFAFIERKLIEGDIEAEDIPALWDEQMMALLKLDTRGNFRDGPLQDVHWPEGLFGYFPCYTLGAMYAAQWFAAMRREMPDLDARITRGELSPVFNWLRQHVWTQASRWTTDELAALALERGARRRPPREGAAAR